ncbi:MAG TPA: nuclear transport factor 2 family protein [Candidatus Dormibacteraeota bacterium]|nr:nuclear transport factor 2 family protein [Candidatus Dormibacteraeota bacterium]
MEELVRSLYAALADWDKERLRELLDPSFEAELPEGMPVGAGGRRTGAEAMIRDTWRPIGRTYAMRPEPTEWIACDGGRLLVLGRYRGHARATGLPVDAAFAHLWTARDGRLVGLRHVTDTALWAAALEGTPA